MAKTTSFVTLTLLLLLTTTRTHQQDDEPQQQLQLPVLPASEQEAAYRALELINSDIPWRTIFPDDLCASAPHGVVYDYFLDPGDSGSSTQPSSAHITELNFGFVSDYNSNPPCSPNAILPSWVFSDFPKLRKLFIFNCFVATDNNQVLQFPDIPLESGSNLEELVLIDNPSLTGSLAGIVNRFVNLKKLVVTGSGFSGEIPMEMGALSQLEQMILSYNRLNGAGPSSLANLTNLKLLDLSHNEFKGTVFDSVGELKQLLKLDLSFNKFSGRIPDRIGELGKLEFLDLSYNNFGSYGVPLFLSGMNSLKELHLSGNQLKGSIPDVWGKLGGLVGLGFAEMGLTGAIPESMAASLTGLSYLSLENNSLSGKLPDGFLEMESWGEINLENNKLSGVVMLRGNITVKRLKLAGNPGLCVDRTLTDDGDRYGVGACGASAEMPVNVGHVHLHHYPASASSVDGTASCMLLMALLGFLALGVGF